MSTLLKSAAMTLLSKTLQTFLYRYLEDVDVEGVALPSLYSSDGPASGWGVRLSNVRLRSGVTLVPRLPGEGLTRRRRRRRRYGRRRTAEPPSVGGGPGERRQRTSDGPNSGGAHANAQGRSVGTETASDEPSLPPANPEAFCPSSNEQQLRRSSSSSSVRPSSENSVSLRDIDPGGETDGPPPRTCPRHADVGDRLRQPFYYSSDEDDGDGDDEGMNKPPTQTSSGILSCFIRRQPAEISDNANANLSQSERNYSSRSQALIYKDSGRNALAARQQRQPARVGSNRALDPSSRASWHGVSRVRGSAVSAAAPTATNSSSSNAFVPAESSHRVRRHQPFDAHDPPHDLSETSDVTFAQTLSSQYLHTPPDPPEAIDDDFDDDSDSDSVSVSVRVHRNRRDDTTLADKIASQVQTSKARQAERSENNSTADQIEPDGHEATAGRTDDDYAATVSNNLQHDEYEDITENDDENSQGTDEEYWEEYKQPVKLQLGEGGRIGIIDVRLISKEIHVMIEDAELAVDIVPVGDEEKDSDDNPSSNNNDTKDNDLTDDGGNPTTNRQSANTESNSSKPVNTDDPSSGASAKSGNDRKPSKRASQTQEAKTAGERVMAEIAIAKALSAIPHLFLRDIKIKVSIKNYNHDHNNDCNNNDAGSSHSRDATDDHEDGFTNETNNDASRKSDDRAPLCDEAVFEIGVDFLSVSSDDDILSHFQTTAKEDGTEHDSQQEPSVDHAPPIRSIPSYSSVENGRYEENDYLVRHIRTGRGPSGGVWLRIVPPKLKEAVSPKFVRHDHVNASWARNRWVVDTDYFLFRCSGVDLYARVFVGTKADGGNYSSWFYTEEEDDSHAYEETLDSVLLGIDYVAPGPQLPLPPIKPNGMSRGDTPTRDGYPSAPSSPRSSSAGNFLEEFDVAEELQKVHRPDTGMYHRDKNGIQSCNVPSSFHRVSRGLLPRTCLNRGHLPHETCDQCWECPSDEAQENPLDYYTPMPGLVMQLTVRDSIDFNIDRASLESIGLLVQLLKKQPKKSALLAKPTEATHPAAPPVDVPSSCTDSPRTTTTAKTTQSPGYFSRLFYSRPETKEEEDTSYAFPEYMQPEKVQIIGVHIAQISVRVHVMREQEQRRQYQLGSSLQSNHRTGASDNGLAFCYWELDLQSVTMDRQVLDASEKTYQENYVEVGNLTLTEFKGTGRKGLASLGIPVPLRGRCDSAASLATSIASIQQDLDHSKTPWPTTANAMLNLPPPLETLMYRTRERHGLQLRHNEVQSEGSDTTRSSVNVRLGVATISLPFSIDAKIKAAQKEAARCILPRHAHAQKDSTGRGSTKDTDRSPGEEPGKPNEDEGTTCDPVSTSKTTVRPTTSPPSLMGYKVQIDGASICISPLIDIQFPMTHLCGEHSTVSGVSLQTVLDKLHVAYGKKHSPVVQSRSHSGSGCADLSDDASRLTLRHLADLPETVRMRMLMFLDDLKPLEVALGIKKHKNSSFIRCRAVNKAIVKRSDKSCRLGTFPMRPPGVARTSSSRVDMVNELMSLDNTELEELLKIRKERHWQAKIHS